MDINYLIEESLKTLKTVGWFWQGLITTFSSMILIWLGRKFIWLIKYLWISRTANQEEQIAKHIVHKYHISKNGLYDFMFGYSFAFHKVMRNVIPGILSLILGHALYLIFNKIIFELIGFYVAAQYLINALSWLNPKWGELDLRDFDFKLVQKVGKEFEKYDIHSKQIFEEMKDE